MRTRRIKPYIHQKPHWPNFTWDNELLLAPLAEVRNAQGKIVGKMEALGFDLGQDASLDTLTIDAVKSTEIEGEVFDAAEVRSSFAKRLGITLKNPAIPVEMLTALWK